GCDADAAVESRIVDEEIAVQLAGLAGVNLDFRLATGALADDHVGKAIAIDVAAGDEDASGEVGAKRKHALQKGEIGSAKDFDMRPAPRTGAGDDVGESIVIHIARADARSTGECLAIRVETLQQREIGAAEHLDVGPAAGPGTGNDVRPAVAIDVAG